MSRIFGGPNASFSHVSCAFIACFQHHGEGEGGALDDEKELEGLEKSFEAGVKLAKGHQRVCLECFAPEGTPIQVGKRRLPVKYVYVLLKAPCPGSVRCCPVSRPPCRPLLLWATTFVRLSLRL